jgi:hypothetical protein
VNAITPDKNSATVNNEVPMGRLINGVEMLMVNPRPPVLVQEPD